jgi:hypothetical protein
MRQYHIHQIDNDGHFLSGASYALTNDEAALAKARELCEGNCIAEIWQDHMRLAVVHPEQNNAISKAAPAS